MKEYPHRASREIGRRAPRSNAGRPLHSHSECPAPPQLPPELEPLFSPGGAGFGTYAEGTDFVPHTGMYKLHEGEAVLTAKENAREKRDDKPIVIENKIMLDGVQMQRWVTRVPAQRRYM